MTRAVTTGSTNYPAWGLSETYDRYGNRSTQSIYSGCTGITCPTNSVTPDTATNRISGSPYAYDLSGNMTIDGNNTLVYDAENRAVSATNGGSSGTYTYDGNGLRVKKIFGSTTTVYIFSGAKVIAEYVNGAAPASPSREYIYSGGMLLAKIDSSGTKYYHQDHLSNRLVTDSSGNTIAQLGHFPYGESWYNASGDKLLFTTYERDSESGNDYAQARYNVSRLARFSSPDQVAGNSADPQSLNRYSYVRNMPVMLTDPSGLYVNCVAQNRDTGAWQETPGGGLPMPGSEGNLADPEPEPQSGCGGGGGGDGWWGWGGDGWGLGGCTVVMDYGAPMDCGSGLLGPGGINGGVSSAPCPNNACSGSGTNSKGETFYVQFVAFNGGKSGYFYAPDLSNGINELNGKLYTDAAYLRLVGQGVEESQRAANARLLSALLGWSYASAYLSLTPPSDGQPVGGNYNFVVSDEMQKALVSIDACAPSFRCGNFDSLDFTHNGVDSQFATVHMDTANPHSMFGFGLVVHFFWDVFLGNTEYAVAGIPRH